MRQVIRQLSKTYLYVKWLITDIHLGGYYRPNKKQAITKQKQILTDVIKSRSIACYIEAGLHVLYVSHSASVQKHDCYFTQNLVNSVACVVTHSCK